MNRRDFIITGAAAGLILAARPSALFAQDAELPEVPDLVLGNPDATVTVTEYASYTCPHCATFHDAVFKPLKRDYIDTGKIRFVYREVLFDRYGLWAAMVARCGGEMRYFGIQEMLYKQQQEWAASDNPNEVVENLRRIGRVAGLEDAQLEACLSDGAMAQAMVNKHETDAAADNITSTPSLVINGVKHGNMSFAELSGLIDAELAK
ncbi:DsbA family protein [Szabonella alba]|uniref:DsbA family protein n=1 Tax=Szabonella alba TaxID=2804194 RepID=A0A8K0Y2T0_9RHOB|nr:DsbA family protein [Szabonella alba]MBL4919099.1 DsbA family protein [Szabonella alba]